MAESPPTPGSGGWADYEWPEWIPEPIRQQIKTFWLPEWGRGPWSWQQDMAMQGAPPLGAVVTLRNGFGSDAPMATGRYVHCWNNIGRLVLEDGSWVYTSFSRTWDSVASHG